MDITEFNFREALQLAYNAGYQECMERSLAHYGTRPKSHFFIWFAENEAKLKRFDLKLNDVEPEAIISE